MSNPYPPFSGDGAICPKCRGGMDKRYQSAGTIPVGSRLDMVRCAPGPEWMLRECIDCDYRWAEMCADASPAPTTPETDDA